VRYEQEAGTKWKRNGTHLPQAHEKFNTVFFILLHNYWVVGYSVVSLLAVRLNNAPIRCNFFPLCPFGRLGIRAAKRGNGLILCGYFT
jgi:hypothetical protein